MLAIAPMMSGMGRAMVEDIASVIDSTTGIWTILLKIRITEGMSFCKCSKLVRVERIELRRLMRGL